MTDTEPTGRFPVKPRPDLPRRFYETAGVAERPGGWAVVLDGRPVRTPKRAELVLPHLGLAEAVAAEWATQEGVIDPAAMPMTRLSNTAIDGVSAMMQAVVQDAAHFAESDLVCYRAEEPEELVARQTAAWDPLVEWARSDLGLRLNLAAGVMHVAQPEGTLDRAGALLAGLDAFELAGVHVMTALTGSLVIALAVAHGRLTAEEGWRLSLVDEDWQIGQWGEDAEAMQRRALRWRDMAAAARFATARRG